MGGVEGHPGLDGMVPAHCGPGDRPVAVLAIAAQCRPVAVVLTPDPVAVIAAHGRAFINPVQMAGGAGDLEVTPLEWESPRLVEAAGNRTPAGGGMTGLAFLGHRTLMGFGMAEATVSLIRHVGTNLVAGGTVFGQGGVLAFKGKTGLDRVVKILRVERPDVDVGALMLLVAGLAIPGDFAVDSLFRGDPFGHRPVTRQAAAGVDLLRVHMAFPAVRLALQRAVCLGQWAGRLRPSLRILPREGKKSNQE